VKYLKDKKEILIKAVNYTIKQHRPDLSYLSFATAWRTHPKYSEGKLVAAEVIKFSTLHRDLHGKDVLLLVDKEIWKDLSKEEKKKLIFHELEHVVVEFEGQSKKKKKKKWEQEDLTAQEIFESLLEERNVDGTPKEDKEGRIKFKLVPHDLDLRRFRSELSIYGLSAEEEGMRNYLNHIAKTVGKTRR
jgi:predicted metallopeptidase